MAVKFYRLMATDGCPSFEPVSQFGGAWSGVAKVEDDAEIERLDKRGCKEIGEAEYNATVKKKALQQSPLGDFRLIDLRDAQLVGRKDRATAKAPPEPVQVAIDPVQVTRPAKLPRFKSKATESP